MGAQAVRRFRAQSRNKALIINCLLREPYLPASYATLDHQARVTFFIRIWMPFSNKCQYPSILTSACIGRLRMRLGLSPPRVSQADKFPILHVLFLRAHERGPISHRRQAVGLDEAAHSGGFCWLVIPSEQAAERLLPGPLLPCLLVIPARMRAATTRPIWPHIR